MNVRTRLAKGCRFILRALMLLLGFLLAILLIVFFCLTRDQAPRMAARHGRLASVEAGPSVATGALIDQELRLVSSSGLEVALRVRRPRTEPERPRSTLVLLGGLRTGRDAALRVDDMRGAVVAALSYPGEVRQIRGGPGALADIAAIRRSIVDVAPSLMLAADYLCAQPYVDPERVELVGVSLGAPFTCVAGALDVRYRRVWAVQGGGRLRLMLERSLEAEIGSSLGRKALAWLAFLLGHGSSLSPEKWAGRISPRPFVMVNSLRDQRIPEECVQALFDAAAEPKEQIWLAGQHLDRAETEELRALCDIVLSRVEGD